MSAHPACAHYARTARAQKERVADKEMSSDTEHFRLLGTAAVAAAAKETAAQFLDLILHNARMFTFITKDKTRPISSWRYLLRGAAMEFAYYRPLRCLGRQIDPPSFI